MSLTLEDIQSLSEEIRHLVDAGLPLETALRDAGAGRGERLQAAIQLIAAELDRGQSLVQIVAAQSIGPPRMLAAALGAGIQSNRLPLALELMGDFASDLVDLRARLLQAAAYPLIVVAMAGLLLCAIVQQTMEQLLTLIVEWRLPINWRLLRLLEWNAAMPWWTYLIPVAFVLLLTVWAISGRAAAMAFRGPERLLLLIPGVGALVRDLRYYTVARMMSLLTERGLPLADALELSGSSSGSRTLEAACSSMADSLRRGQVMTTRQGTAPLGTGESAVVVPAKFPPLLSVCLKQTGQSEQRLVHRLRSTASFYRSRLERNGSWIRVLLPMVLFIVVGGGTALIYCGMIFWPIAEIYRHLGN